MGPEPAKNPMPLISLSFYSYFSFIILIFISSLCFSHARKPTKLAAHYQCQTQPAKFTLGWFSWVRSMRNQEAGSSVWRPSVHTLDDAEKLIKKEHN